MDLAGRSGIGFTPAGNPSGPGCSGLGTFAGECPPESAAVHFIGWLIRSFRASLIDGWVKMKSRRKV